MDTGKIFATAVLLCVLTTSAAFGQSGNGQITGVVQDSSRALIPGVTVTMTSVGTGLTSTQVSNESGAYGFASVLPGTYRLTASLPGFKTAAANDLSVSAGTVVRHNFTLEVGEVSSQVEVSVSGLQALTESQASVGDVLPTQRAQDLPLISKDVMDLVRIMPGFAIDPIGEQFSMMAGLPINTVNTTRDGISVVDPRSASGAIFSNTTINPDLVGEIRIIVTPVDAELGRGNGQVVITTRSGTNKYTGALVWNVRNTGFNANTWTNNNDINPITGKWDPTRPNWRNTHQITGSYGGPIVQNKTFFFFLYDRNISKTRTLEYVNVLTDTAREGIFRYWERYNPQHGLSPLPTAFPITGTNPTYRATTFDGKPLAPPVNPDGTPYNGRLICFSVFGTTKASGGAFTSADCPGGTAVTPAGASWDSLRPAIDSTGYIRKLITAMPKANLFFPANPTTANSAVDGLNIAVFRYLRGRNGNTGGGATNGTTPEDIDRKQYNLKIDQNFNANHRLSASWSYQFDDNTDNVANWEGGLHGSSLRRPQVFTSSFTSTLTPAIVNEARFGINYGKNEVIPPYYSKDDKIRTGAEAWLLKGGQSANGKTLPVSFSAGAGDYAFGNGPINFGSTYSGSNSPQYTIADTVSWSRGSHSLRMGAEVRLISSTGFSGNILPTAAGGAGTNTATTISNANPLLPLFNSDARGDAANMLYLLSGSVNAANQEYWIDSDDDFKNKTWEDWSTNQKRLRTVKNTEMAIFFKDDWKVTRNLTLNLGLRWEDYGAPYVKGGFTSAIVGRGYGLFGQGLITGNPFDNYLMALGGVYLSGYGSNAGANSLLCSTGTANPNGLPASKCDPNKLTQMEFVGPGSDQPNKTGIPTDRNNIGPAIGFAWSPSFLGEGKTSVRGGFQMTFGGAVLNNAGGLETQLANSPGSTSSAVTVRNDFADPVLNLTMLPRLVPVKPTNPSLPGATFPIYGRSGAFTDYDPEFFTQYTQNFTLSVTRTINRYINLDVRYTGTAGRGRQGNIIANQNNVFYNKELFDALEITRNGGNAPLFDQMFAGLNMSNTTTEGYGPVGTTVTKNGVAVLQTGSLHLRRRFAATLADGNYLSIANTINSLSSGTGLAGTGNLQPLTALTGVGGRVLRNGCDRIANGLYNPALPASATNIPARCFPENYMVANPQIATGTYRSNTGGSIYHGLQIQANLRPLFGISNQSTYTWSKALVYMPSGWNDPLDRNADYGIGYNDYRHDFRMNGSAELPFGPNKLIGANTSGWVARLLERWNAGYVFTWNSAPPRLVSGRNTRYATAHQNIDQGQNKTMIVSPLYKGNMDNHVVWNGDTGTMYGSNWAQVPDPACAKLNYVDAMGYNLSVDCAMGALAIKNADGSIGPIVLQNPVPGQVGNHGLTLSGLGRWRMDASLGKSFRLTESKSLQIRTDIANILNHPDLADGEMLGAGDQVSDANNEFGRILAKTGSSTGPVSRNVTFSLRLTF